MSFNKLDYINANVYADSVIEYLSLVQIPRFNKKQAIKFIDIEIQLDRIINDAQALKSELKEANSVLIRGIEQSQNQNEQ